ncbi:DUF6653 family protein [Halopenitus persicus]|uniref:Uncharacterized protein n=1 Tax=Halopenitus persicus TaxID=1048396 RepID=A0A1H3MWP6_9EURY|nr:DUF6653 family protein [Halopenitus persicus]SDY80409.1 hypothetical protein SAMN05216564_11097 [Halopenitus persicus]
MESVGEFSETFWNRHSNPKSGWSRMLVFPVLLYAVYQRRWRVAGAAVVFTALNPILFSPPTDDQAWMTRVVLAERWWTTEYGQPIFELSYPNVLNVLNIPVAGYAFIAAYRQRPRHTMLAGVVSMALKLWYVAALVRRYDAEKEKTRGK